MAQAKQDVASKDEEAKKLLKFKIIVEDGELYLQCIDAFEDIFEISPEAIENLELTELLDPYMFDSHRDIINALFEAGGPSKTGTMRDFQLKRNGQTVVNFDMYDFLLVISFITYCSFSIHFIVVCATPQNLQVNLLLNIINAFHFKSPRVTFI